MRFFSSPAALYSYFVYKAVAAVVENDRMKIIKISFQFKNLTMADGCGGRRRRGRRGKKMKSA